LDASWLPAKATSSSQELKQLPIQTEELGVAPIHVIVITKDDYIFNRGISINLHNFGSFCHCYLGGLPHPPYAKPQHDPEDYGQLCRVDGCLRLGRAQLNAGQLQEMGTERAVHKGETPKMVGFPNWPMGFPTKNDHFWSVYGGTTI